MDYSAVIGMIIQLAGTAAGQAASQMDKDEAMRLIQSSVDETGKINVPKLQALFLKQQGPSGLANIKDDPTYRSQQNAADAQLGDVIDSGGLTLADKAALNAIRNRTAQTESAGRNAIESGMAARGTLDSGSQLAMELQGNQQSANELAQADESQAAQAQARAFQAIKERAALAGQGLDRSYRQQSDAARAQDAINAGNTAIANTALKYNAEIPQQNFTNQMSLATAKQGPAYALAGAHAANAKDTQQAYQGYGNMAAAAAKSAGSTPNPNSGGYDYDQAAQGNVPAWQDPSNSSPGGTDWSSYDAGLSGASTRPPATGASDGSENYEIDPATGKIRRKAAQQGQNF